jgi:hypothetical protein
MVTMSSCATGADERVYYTLDMLVDKSIDYAKHIRFRYGELGEHEKPVAKPNGVSIISMGLEMNIPEDFEISWETPDGKGHHKVVPVRGRIKNSVKGKSILFLILYDDVQGYISTNTPTGEVRERFY